MRFLTMLVLGAASVTSFAGTTVPRVRAESRMTIALVAAPDVDQPLLDHIVEEAGAIWGAAGITFEWTRASAPAVPDGRRIAIVIDDVQPDLSEPDGPLGWIVFTPDGPEPLIHLSRARADVLSSRCSTIENKTAVGRERLVGRALGRAFAHELGHYLLHSNMHTRHGLMRATWPSDQLFSVDRRGFELTADQRTVGTHRAASSELTFEEDSCELMCAPPPSQLRYRC